MLCFAVGSRADQPASPRLGIALDRTHDPAIGWAIEPEKVFDSQLLDKPQNAAKNALGGRHGEHAHLPFADPSLDGISLFQEHART
jgi:hypothetical protein